jgi:hypothetical protein
MSFVNKLISWFTKNLIRVRIEDSTIIVPVEEQSVYEPPGMTLYSGTVTSNGN